MNVSLAALAVALGLLFGARAQAEPFEPMRPPLPISGNGVGEGPGGATGAMDPASPPDLGAESGLPLEAYADALDYDVSYDDTIAASYDDGYAPEAYAQFADALAPHGTWIDDPDYGRIWVPSPSEVGQDFTPYATNGDWVDTEYGWTWSSGWAWGWAPFHYGRWIGREGAGWCWVPGTLWGPAWVSWRAGGGYVGWAPLPPRGISMGSPIGVHSPWRFAVAARLGRTHGAYLAPRFVPGVFGLTSVVSNPRLLASGRGAVRTNAGPALSTSGAGARAPARLASVAPQAVPRAVIEPRAGMAVAGRPWVRSGASAQFQGSRLGALAISPLSGLGVAGSGGRLGGGALAPAPRYGTRLSRPADGAAGAWSPTFVPWGNARSSGVSPPFTRSFAAPATAASPRFTAAPPSFTAASPRFTAAPPSFTTAPAAPVFRPVAPSYPRASFPAGGAHSSGGRHR